MLDTSNFDHNSISVIGSFAKNLKKIQTCDIMTSHAIFDNFAGNKLTPAKDVRTGTSVLYLLNYVLTKKSLFGA